MRFVSVRELPVYCLRPAYFSRNSKSIPIIRTFLVLFTTTLLIALCLVTDADAAGTLRLDIDGQRVEGNPISSSANHMYLPARPRRVAEIL